MSNKVVVGLSGGVDSSVAAYLLKQEGYEVLGVTMCVLDSDYSEIENMMLKDAGKVAEMLGIAYEAVDFREIFHSRVVDYFTGEYLKGRTPNPCVMCNRYVKWEAIQNYAAGIGADYIATGHYAQIGRLENGRYVVRNSVTAAKDQTYVLYQLTQEQLSHTLMPVGKYSKEQIREIAGEAGFEIAKKKDSQEICFIPDHDYAEFIRKEQGCLAPGTGNFVDTEGNILGQHQGITHYTIGQRKGLGLAFGRPVFVSEIRPKTNEVVIGDESAVMGCELLCDHVNFMAIEGLKPGEELHVLGKIRYAHQGTGAVIRMQEDGRLKAVFDEPVRAITPGQSAVFYDGDCIVCGGLIC